uniref:Uncharacterized protein LOC111111870 n=1 Tax=Crassostrea virginica TaxID=6565 RepID=A0A8B8BN26_CRAVI|nr:uncharacterized protein LOC111111870 [Crassostrea virginica]
MVVRFDKDGQLTMTIPDVHTKDTLFEDPNYIAENTNGDVVVSDYWHGVVVTDYEGKHLFTYKDTPFGSRLLPRGICTDTLSNIFVCDCYTETIQILNKEGNFLFYILAQKAHGPCGKPCSLSYDSNTHLLWVGSWNNTLSRYSHMKRPFISSDSREICIDKSCEVPSCFNNPMHCEGLNSFFSVLQRCCDYISNTAEEQSSFADIMKISFKTMCVDVGNEFIKTATSQALKYQIPMEEAVSEIGKGLLKCMAFMHANYADTMMRNKESVDGDGLMEMKLYLFEMESYLLNIEQHRDLPQVFQQISEDKDAVVKVTELLRERIERIQTTFNTECASFTEYRALCKDVFNLVMDVISHFNQAGETTFVKHITEKE